ncbi:MAG: hypothetical protein V9E83_14820 [Baekduia sp.]
MLLLVPNISEGRDRAAIDAIGAAYVAAGAVLLDTHADPDHHRSVHTLVVPDQAQIPAILTAGAREAIARIDLRSGRGLHPHVGALDVAPVVYRDISDRGAACAAALTAAEAVGQLGLPVFLYGALAAGRTRADLRRGGTAGLQQRIDDGELAPDFGPSRLHESGGAVLVAARPPLVAFNVELAHGTTLAEAKEIAATIREGPNGEGLPGVRAIGLELVHEDGLRLVQVSTNVEDHRATPLVKVVEAVAAHAPVTGAELVGLAPRAAFDGFPEDVPVRHRCTLEGALEGISS